jgi:7,8-dihydropterin-6-yl-methyl-4-(beta-D-ribofuranosyl)aminobenzene 5'-phosphate synthase
MQMRGGRITVLVENTAGGRGLLAEHGLSFWIEHGSHRILFDTGQSDILLKNAQILRIDLSQTDAIILSHGHYDHVGGLHRILEIAPAAPVYLHPQALEAKYVCRDGQGRQIGMEPDLVETSRRRIDSGLGSFTTGPVEVLPGAWITGEVPRKSALEDTGGAFYLDPDCAQPDMLLDDQAVVLETSRGLVVVLGCAHAGVVNTLDYIADLFTNRPIRTVLGGMHLVGASKARIAYTVDAIQRHDVQQIGPAHCTGPEASRELWSALPEKCFMCNVGAHIML